MAQRKRALSWKALTLIGALAVIWAVFVVTTHGTFVSPRNLALLARQMSVTALLAVGMVMVIVTGEIDLSVGAMAGLLGGIAAILSVSAGWPLVLAFPAVLALGALAGFLQGSLVAWLKVPSFIVTLGGMLVFQGALLGALVMASLDNGMSLMNTEPFWQPILKGAILVAAVAADMAGRRRGEV